MIERLFVASFAFLLVVGTLALLAIVLQAIRWLAVSGSARPRISDVPEDDELDPDLLVVLTAAAAEALGSRVRVHHAHVHRERSAEIWSRAGRMDVMLSHRLEQKR